MSHCCTANTKRCCLPRFILVFDVKVIRLAAFRFHRITHCVHFVECHIFAIQIFANRSRSINIVIVLRASTAIAVNSIEALLCIEQKVW